MSEQQLSPRKRLQLFFELSGFTANIAGIVCEIVEASVYEFADLLKHLLPNSSNLLTPEFLQALQRDETDAFESVSLTQLGALRKAFDVPDSLSMPTQFLVDGFELWLSRQDFEQIAKLVSGCGLQRWVVDQVKSVSRQKIHDFLIAIVFPPSGAATDWLHELKARREAVDVEDVIQFPAAPPDSFPPRESPRQKPTTPGRPSTSTAQESSGSRKRHREALETEELLLTEENLPHIMETSPRLVPKDILIARRHPIKKGISEFELNNHYTLHELRAYANENKVPIHGGLKIDFARSIFEFLEASVR